MTLLSFFQAVNFYFKAHLPIEASSLISAVVTSLTNTGGESILSRYSMYTVAVDDKGGVPPSIAVIVNNCLIESFALLMLLYSSPDSESIRHDSFSFPTKKVYF